MEGCSEQSDGFCGWGEAGDWDLAGQCVPWKTESKESLILDAVQQVKKRSPCLGFPAAVEGHPSVCLQCHLEI